MVPLALTWTKVAESTLGNKYIKLFTIAFDNSYPTGGETYTNADIRMAATPDLVIVLPHEGYVFDWDSTNKKIQARALSIAGGAAVAGTDTLSIKAGVLNKEAVGAANVGLQEATSTADLSGLAAVPVIVIGSHAA